MSELEAYRNRSVAVLGGGGFIGQHLLAQLLGYTTRAVSVGGFTSGSSMLDSVREFGGRITESLLAALPDKPEIIFHLAGGASVARSVENPRQDFDLTVQSTLEVLEYLRTRNPTCSLVYVSSAAVYGNTSRSAAGGESVYAPTSPYGLHKLLAEQQCSFYARAHGLKVAIVRPFSVYGPGLRKQLLWDALNKVDRGKPEFFGSGQEMRDWIYVSDLANLLLQIGGGQIVTSPDTPIDAGTGRGTSVKQVLALLLDAYAPGVKPNFIGADRDGDPSELVAHKSIESVQQVLSTVDLKIGLARYVAWYRQEMRRC